MTSKVNLALHENNDETVFLSITGLDGNPFDLTSAVVDVFIKNGKDYSDTDVSTIHLSTSSGEVVVTDSVNGLATATVAATNLPSPAIKFWRVDVLSSGKRRTACYGTLTVVDL